MFAELKTILAPFLAAILELAKEIRSHRAALEANTAAINSRDEALKSATDAVTRAAESILPPVNGPPFPGWTCPNCNSGEWPHRCRNPFGLG